MLNVVSFWRAMKLLSRMQRAKNPDRDETGGRAGLASPGSDDRSARRGKPTRVECDESAEATTARTRQQIVQAIAEAITISRYLWYGEAEGITDLERFSLGAAAPGPAPAHRIGIWLGASGPRMLNLLGRRADGWIAPLSTGFETKPAAQDRIDRAAIGGGREPSDIRRVMVVERFDTVNVILQHETPEQIAAFGEQGIPLARDAVNARSTDK